MAKMMRKMMALVLALALCLSQMALPVLADTTVTNEDGSVTVTSDPVTNPDGSVTVTITTTSTDGTSETIQETATTTGENIEIVEDSSITVTDTEEGQITDGSEGITITEENIPTGNVQEDIILNPDAEAVPQPPQEPTELEGSTDTQEGNWTDVGEAQDQLTAEGAPTEEVFSNPEGTTTTDTITIESELTVDDGTDDVLLDFTAPSAEEGVAYDVVQVPITEDKAQEYRDMGYEVEPVYAQDAQGNPTDEVIGLVATKRTPVSSQPAEPVTGTVTTTGETSYGQADQGTLVADAALDAEAALGVQNVDTGAANQTKTTELVKTGGENPTYTRTTKTVTNTSSTGEPMTLTEEEMAAYASSVRGQSTTSFLYLSKNEKAEEVLPDGSINRYSYQYTQDADGNITAITEVQECLDADGNVKARFSETQFCATVTITPITIIDPTTKVETTFTETTEVITETITNTQYNRTATTTIERVDTTTNEYNLQQDTYTYIEGDALLTDENGNRYFVYEGKMYAVVDKGGDPYSTNASLEDPDGRWEQKENHYLEGEDVVKTVKDGWGYDKESSSTVLFRIRSGGESRAVYCIELGQTTSLANYNAEVFTDDTTDDGAANWGPNIRQAISVAHNGYWGAESGIGSLASVKSLLRLHQDEINKNGVILTDEDIENLSAKDAVTATQVALWEYGSPSNTTFQDDFSKNDTIVILRNLLVDLAEEDAANNVVENADGTTSYLGAAQEITSESVTGAAIQLKNQVMDAITGNPAVDQQSNELYNTNLILKMNISESSINGNLLINVVDANNNTLGQYRLADDGTGNLLTDAAANVADAFTGTKQVKANGDGTYTLENLVLPNGVKFSVNISGTQHLDDGVTIYMNNNHQDFIGLVSKDKNVALSFAMEFSVTEPEMEKTSGSYTQTGTSTQTYTGTRSQEQTKTDLTVVTTGSLYTEQEILTTFRGDSSVVDEKITESAKEFRWEVYNDVPEETEPEETEPEETEPEETIPEETIPEETEPQEPGGEEPVPHDGDIPIDDPGVPMMINFLWDDGIEEDPDDDEIIIPDEAVPLAKAPNTGDISGIWAAISLFSLGGSAMLGRKRDED